MIITEFDCPLTAEDARKISLNNREDSKDRSKFREIMTQIKEAASHGHTRLLTTHSTKAIGNLYGDHPSDHVQNVLRSFGFKVIEKRAYEWNSDYKTYSDKPLLNFEKRETFFLEITWG